MPQEIDCPQCHTINRVPDLAIGSYVPCNRCNCKFWVTVPPLGEVSRPALRETVSEKQAIDSEESQRNGHLASKTLMRQEALLSTIAQELTTLRKTLQWLNIGVFILVIIGLAACVALLR